MLIRFPDGWPTWLAALVAMCALAALDLGGAVAAKEAVERRSLLFAGFGVTAFVLLFWVFASSLQYADLTPVTFGWIVILQIGVVLLDRYRYGTVMPAGHWVAIAIMIAAQAYLMLGMEGAPRLPGAGTARTTAADPHASPSPSG